MLSHFSFLIFALLSFDLIKSHSYFWVFWTIIYGDLRSSRLEQAKADHLRLSERYQRFSESILDYPTVSESQILRVPIWEYPRVRILEYPRLSKSFQEYLRVSKSILGYLRVSKCLHEYPMISETIWHNSRLSKTIWPLKISLHSHGPTFISDGFFHLNIVHQAIPSWFKINHFSKAP